MDAALRKAVRLEEWPLTSPPGGVVASGRPVRSLLHGFYQSSIMLGPKKTTNTILGVPYYNYSIMGRGFESDTRCFPNSRV